MSKTESAKAEKKPKADAKDQKTTAATATPAEESPVTEAPTEATAAPEAPASTEGAFNESGESNILADILASLGLGRGDFLLSPIGFEFSDDDSDNDDECCGGTPLTTEDVYAAGVQDGLRRASHPVFGIGITAPVLEGSEVIEVVDETTQSFAHLIDLKKLHDAGILTDTEYEHKKADILKHIY